jgi:hypothetical protein
MPHSVWITVKVSEGYTVDFFRRKAKVEAICSTHSVGNHIHSDALHRKTVLRKMKGRTRVVAGEKVITTRKKI